MCVRALLFQTVACVYLYLFIFQKGFEALLGRKTIFPGIVPNTQACASPLRTAHGVSNEPGKLALSHGVG